MLAYSRDWTVVKLSKCECVCVTCVYVCVCVCVCVQVSSGAKMTGTAWWMAPELVPGGKQTDAASDKSDVW